MADLRVSQLPSVAVAGGTDKLIINTGSPQETKTITVDEFRSGSSGSARSFMVNFPTDPGFVYDAADGRHNIASPSNSITGNFKQTTELYDIFKDVTPITMTMPPGTDSAVITFTYSGRLRSSASIGSNTGVVGYANISSQLNIASNKGTADFSPGSVFSVPLRMYGPIMPYNQYTSIDASVRDSRAPSQLMYAAKSMRVYFPESTFESPTILTFSLFSQVHRMRHSTVAVSTGRVAVHPYKNDTLDDFGRAMVDAVVTASSDEDGLIDDNGVDLPFIEETSSRTLKDRMLSIIQAIDETLRYDGQFDTEFPPTTDTGVPGGTGTNGNMTPRELLQKNAEDVMVLKRNQSYDYTQMETELDAIVNQATPYVAFKFDWQVNSFASFF